MNWRRAIAKACWRWANARSPPNCGARRARTSNMSPRRKASGRAAGLPASWRGWRKGPRAISAAARRWLMAASNADPDPGWQCRRCGTLADRWRANCAHCHAFDSLVWQAPHRQAAIPHIAGPGAGRLAGGRLPAGPRQRASAPPWPGTPATTIEAEPLPAPVDAARLVN